MSFILRSPLLALILFGLTPSAQCAETEVCLTPIQKAEGLSVSCKQTLDAFEQLSRVANDPGATPAQIEFTIQSISPGLRANNLSFADVEKSAQKDDPRFKYCRDMNFYVQYAIAVFKGETQSADDLLRYIESQGVSMEEFKKSFPWMQKRSDQRMDIASKLKKPNPSEVNPERIRALRKKLNLEASSIWSETAQTQKVQEGQTQLQRSQKIFSDIALQEAHISQMQHQLLEGLSGSSTGADPTLSRKAGETVDPKIVSNSATWKPKPSNPGFSSEEENDFLKRRSFSGTSDTRKNPEPEHPLGFYIELKDKTKPIYFATKRFQNFNGSTWSTGSTWTSAVSSPNPNTPTEGFVVVKVLPKGIDQTMFSLGTPDGMMPDPTSFSFEGEGPKVFSIREDRAGNFYLVLSPEDRISMAKKGAFHFRYSLVKNQGEPHLGDPITSYSTPELESGMAKAEAKWVLPAMVPRQKAEQLSLMFKTSVPYTTDSDVQNSFLKGGPGEKVDRLHQIFLKDPAIPAANRGLGYDCDVAAEHFAVRAGHHGLHAQTVSGFFLEPGQTDALDANAHGWAEVWDPDEQKFFKVDPTPLSSVSSAATGQMAQLSEATKKAASLKEEAFHAYILRDHEPTPRVRALHLRDKIEAYLLRYQNYLKSFSAEELRGNTILEIELENIEGEIESLKKKSDPPEIQRVQLEFLAEKLELLAGVHPKDLPDGKLHVTILRVHALLNPLKGESTLKKEETSGVNFGIKKIDGFWATHQRGTFNFEPISPSVIGPDDKPLLSASAENQDSLVVQKKGLPGVRVYPFFPNLEKSWDLPFSIETFESGKPPRVVKGGFSGSHIFTSSDGHFAVLGTHKGKSILLLDGKQVPFNADAFSISPWKKSLIPERKGFTFINSEPNDKISILRSGEKIHHSQFTNVIVDQAGNELGFFKNSETTSLNGNKITFPIPPGGKAYYQGVSRNGIGFVYALYDSSQNRIGDFILNAKGIFEEIRAPNFSTYVYPDKEGIALRVSSRTETKNLWEKTFSFQAPLKPENGYSVQLKEPNNFLEVERRGEMGSSILPLRTEIVGNPDNKDMQVKVFDQRSLLGPKGESIQVEHLITPESLLAEKPLHTVALADKKVLYAKDGRIFRQEPEAKGLLRVALGDLIVEETPNGEMAMRLDGVRLHEKPIGFENSHGILYPVPFSTSAGPIRIMPKTNQGQWVETDTKVATDRFREKVYELISFGKALETELRSLPRDSSLTKAQVDYILRNWNYHSRSLYSDTKEVGSFFFSDENKHQVLRSSLRQNWDKLIQSSRPLSEKLQALELMSFDPREDEKPSPLSASELESFLTMVKRSPGSAQEVREFIRNRAPSHQVIGPEVLGDSTFTLPSVPRRSLSPFDSLIYLLRTDILGERILD